MKSKLPKDSQKAPLPDAKAQCAQIIGKIKSMANPKNVEGMARFGINPKNTYGVRGRASARH